MIAARHYPKWFDSFPRCVVCGAKAAGRLMDNFNESLGAHCLSCARKKIRAARGANAAIRAETTKFNPH